MNSMLGFRLTLPALLLALAAPAFAQDTAGDAPAAGAPATVQAEMTAEIAPPPPPVRNRPTTETLCTDGSDDDGDGMTDCADADCFQNAQCQFGSGNEQSDEACSDWLDNDNDGAVDCEDEDCGGNAITVCHGSHPDDASHTAPNQSTHIPITSGDEVPTDLIATGDDSDGERNDYTCSDGIDNDGDGRTDCADFGCRFDPQVTVCTVNPGFRASIVVGIGASYDLEEENSAEAAEVRFSRLQLRVLGSIPYINNSFFLLSMRLERSVRLTFAHFQVPIGSNGHYFALNSGGGNLSAQVIVSAAKQPLLNPAFLLTNAFEQGNGAALELGGPLTSDGFLTYRAFVAGGSGRSNGNVGGRFFPGENENFTYTGGAAVTFNFIGHFNRLDSPMLYTKAPLALAVSLGGKYDQRATERYPAGHAMLHFSHSFFLIRAENYFKYTLDFGGSVQNAFLVQTSILLWPKHILLAADFGMYSAGAFSDLPASSDQDQPLNELQGRVALHWYWYRNIGTLSLLYTHHRVQGELLNSADIEGDRVDTEVEQSIQLEAQFRF